MTSRLLTSLLAAVSLAAPAFADAGVKAVERAFLERAAMTASDKNCNLFTDGERLALKAGLYQSEGELLRAGKDPQEIADITEEVRAHAKSLGCSHPSVMEVAATIRSSYRVFAKTTSLDYAAKNSTWETSRSKHDAWSVKQTDKKSGVIIGLRREDPEKAEEFIFAIAVPYDDKPSSIVQLNLRDVKKMADPWLGKLLSPKGDLQPAARSVSRPEWAGKMTEWEDNVGDWYNVYFLSKSAVERLELLDPREAIEVELTPNAHAKDQTPKKIVFEIGDFRAARAFAMIPAPVYAAPPEAAPVEAPKGGHH
ncbi:MAG TPA: hypothetical protein VGO52_19390 [Hyphomonadaceae bacterium]|jgi:hypothetical protein|nr:hypothetical protein [Hyphomonadaceae bacterium]